MTKYTAMTKKELWVYTPDEMWDTEKKLMRLGFVKTSDAPLTYKKGGDVYEIILK